ncbi:MAG: SpoIID/LytB domain-containing protein [Elusimicrobiaceae bacterium]|nr:SpoIID/LytB domain-containing protein [Elusimicrobiaceae bacterium]
MRKLLFSLLLVGSVLLGGYPVSFCHAVSTEEKLAAAAKLYFEGHPQQALQAYIDLSKETQNKDSFLNATFIALEQGNPKQAVDIVSTAYMLYPHDPEITEFTAEAYLADGQYENAEKFFSLLDGGGEKSEFLLIHVARAQLGMGETELAKHNLQRAATGENHLSLSNYLLGQIYEKEKNWAQAADAYGKAIDYDHQFAEARARYAVCLERNKDYNDAFRQYRILHAASPKNQLYITALQRLRPKITKKEKDLESRKEQKKHTLVKPVISLEGNLQTVRVALGTTAGGRPSPRTQLIFSPSHPFTVTIKNTGKTLVIGKGKEIWRAELTNGKAALFSPTGKRYPFQGAIIVTPKSADAMQGATILIQKVMSGAGMTWASVDDKEYRGQLEIIHDKKHNTLLPINIVNIEEYLMGVLSSEMPAGFPMNALRAQAVLARTYALKHLGKHKAYGYDLCDTQNCQVYGGVGAESETGNAAVESTMGQVLFYQNTPIEGVFSANCGGFTQSAQEAGWYPTAYLNPVSDYQDFNFDTLQPYQFKDLLQHPHQAYSRYNKHVSPAAYRWARVIEEADLRQLIQRQKKDIGRITAIIPQKRGRSGYVTQVLVKGTKGNITLSKENVIRNNLAPGMLRSSYFIVVPNYEGRKLKNFVFYGGGWGHGVGFCQTGSAGRAEAGQDYQTILQHYFPLTELKDMREE